MIVLLLFHLAAGFEKGAAVLVGTQKATYKCRSLISPLPNYQNNGFRQLYEPQTGNIDVFVSNQPLKSRAKAASIVGLPPNCASLEALLKNKNVTYLSQQVAIVINWLRSNIKYTRKSLDRGELSERGFFGAENPSNPLTDSLFLDMVRDQSADCVGLSEMAIYLFSKLGIKSRFVTGVAFRKEDPALLHLRGAVLHRWVEVFYPDAGWVFSDPSGKINYIEATYVVIGIWGEHEIESMVDQLFGKEIELMAFYNGFKLLGSRPELDSRVGLRPNSILQ